MKKRDLLLMGAGALADAATAGGIWRFFGKRLHGEKPSPKNTPSGFPSSYDAVSDMRDYAGRGLAGLQNAHDHGLFPIIEAACHYVNSIFAGDKVLLKTEDLIAVASIESLMDPTIAVKTVGGPKQSALGIMQITQEVFLDQIEKHILDQAPDTRARVAKSLTSENDNHALTMVQALTYAEDKVTKKHHANMSAQNVINFIKRDSDVKDYVLDGRLSPYASMVLAGLDLLLYCNAYPEIGKVFGETQFRAVNQMGPTRTLLMARAFANDPETPMSKIFGMQSDSSDDPRNYIPRNNHIDPDMRLDVFTAIYKNQYRATLRAVTDNFSSAEIPQPFHTSKQMGYAPA